MINNRILIGIISTVTILYWLILLFKINIFQMIPGYFWHFMHYSDTPLEYIWLIIPLAVFSYFIISYVLKNPESQKRNLLLLIFLGYLIQIGFGFMEGRGMEGISNKMVATGHSEFARIASAELEIKDVAQNYEQGLTQNENILFAKTKPPGHLLFYMLTEKASSIISPSTDPEERLKALSTFAAYLYPLLSYLVLIPLFYFIRLFKDNTSAILPCIFYLYIPSITLVILHLDQVLYPLLFMTGLFFILYCIKKQSLVFSIVFGMFVYISLYFSFSLLAVIPAGLLCAAAFIYSENRDEWKSFVYVRLFIGMVAGFLVILMLFWLLLDYNIFVRYQNAIAFHTSWKDWDGSISSTLLHGVLNYIEFACWLGLPFSILFLNKIRLMNFRSIKEHLTFEKLFMLSVIFIFVLLGVFGKTKSEVGRLWIFMMPAVLIFVASEMQKRFENKTSRMLWFILVLQMISILFIKRFQDFW